MLILMNQLKDDDEDENENDKLKSMDNHFEMGLDELRQKLLTMASHAETAVNRAVQALVQRDSELANRVKQDDNIIDQFEIEIDDLAIQLLTKAPLATNL